jgi:two-component system, NarL family, sensor histidine kinase UhpB
MSLGLRLNLLILLLLALLLAAGTVTVVANARKAVSREVASSVSLTLSLLTAATASTDATGLRAVRAALVDRLGKLDRIRHLEIAILGPDGLPLLPVVQHHVIVPARAPEWFVALVRPSTVEYRHGVGVPGGPYAEIAIRPNPADEISEAWERSRTDLALLLAFVTVAMVVISLTVRRALRPVEQILAALDIIQAGDYSARLELPRLPELQRVVVKINSMTVQLDGQQRENRELRRRALAIQETERRLLAQELHDQLGQSVSAIKALAVSIGQRVAGQPEALERASMVTSICDDLHATVANMTRRLRPVVLDELGLHTALRRAVEEWNERNPGTACTLELDDELPVLGEQLPIQLYRMVQEALTNVSRHAHAGHVQVSLVRAANAEGGLVLEIRDDGLGFDPQRSRQGLGLLGMRERAISLGGTLELDSGPGAGTRMRVTVLREAIARAPCGGDVAGAGEA